MIAEIAADGFVQRSCCPPQCGKVLLLLTITDLNDAALQCQGGSQQWEQCGDACLLLLACLLDYPLYVIHLVLWSSGPQMACIMNNFSPVMLGDKASAKAACMV